MTDFIPLQSNLTPTPIYHLDRNAPAADLHGGALQRIKASRDLLHSLDCLRLEGINERDLQHFVQVAHLLLQDGCDAWRLEA
ncbi:hypothetical protein [Pseudomonas piscis]|uniref:hypothetical protein n=1 Tax=Pseudomonas piscis TaxID=2614538 RepID=UPI0021D5F9E5|nr:hypothetical protein [Pseudomonas piscis]